MLFIHIFVFCYRPSSLIPTQLLCMPPHCILTALTWICWLPNPKEQMKWRDFIWGGVRRREKIHKIQAMQNTFYLFTAQLHDCNSFPMSLSCREENTQGNRGNWQRILSFLEEKHFCSLLRKREGKKALLRSGRFQPQSTAGFSWP